MTTQVTQAQLLDMIAALQAENAKLKAKTNGKLTFKVSEKGAVSVYGLGRFPQTLYKSQWERLMGEKDNLLAYIKDNEDRLTTKE